MFTECNRKRTQLLVHRDLLLLYFLETWRECEIGANSECRCLRLMVERAPSVTDEASHGAGQCGNACKPVTRMGPEWGAGTLVMP